MFIALADFDCIGGAFEQKGGEKFQYENYEPLNKGTNLTVVAKEDIPLYHLPGIVYYSRRFDVRWPEG